MSTYLLLRNNKETGPFTVDELKRMSLKAYDLVWVEGKSAAWRYPGEIPELKAFAPQVPKNEEGHQQVFLPAAGSSQGEIYRNGNTARETIRESVYINMPVPEKKIVSSIPPAPKSVELIWEDPEPLTDNKTPAAKVKRSSGRGLLLISVILLFLAGMCTGFFISNRRNFYSADGNPPHSDNVPVMSKDFPQATTEPSVVLTRSDAANKSSVQEITAQPELPNRPVKSKRKPAAEAAAKTDSPDMSAQSPAVPVNADSARMKQEAENKKVDLAAKIKAHPEVYLPVTAGKLKTGMLGGISEFPVTLTNQSGVTMDLVVVTVDYILHNKKIFKTETVRFQDVAPGVTVTGESPKSSRGVQISYRLTTANAQQIGLSYSGN